MTHSALEFQTRAPAQSLTRLDGFIERAGVPQRLKDKKDEAERLQVEAAQDAGNGGATVIKKGPCTGGSIRENLPSFLSRCDCPIACSNFAYFVPSFSGHAFASY
jgi:hypothetical protein